MRYYRLKFYTRGGTAIGGNGFNAMGPVIPFEYTSLGSFLGFERTSPGALDIQFDVTIGLLSTLVGPSHIRIYNPPLDVVKNATIYQDMKVTLEAGFVPGLPIANRLYQIGYGNIVCFGSVANSFANYVGTDMALDLVIVPSVWFGAPYTSAPGFTGTTLPVNRYPDTISVPNAPRGFTFQWTKGQSFMQAITQTLNSAGFTVQGTLNPKLLNNTEGEDYAGSWTSIQQFATWLQNFSRNQVNPSTPNTLQEYSGVKMTIGQNDTITLFDGTQEYPEIQLAPEDFIGQPTWQTFPEIIQTVHPLRGDFAINRSLIFPKSLPNQLTPPSSNNIYNQTFLRGVEKSIINQVRHVGRFRDMSPNGWTTTVNSITAFQVPQADL